VSVAGPQKIGGNVPVQAAPPGGRGGAPSPKPAEKEVFSDIFIKRPILATVSSAMVILAGAIAIPTLPLARYPDLTPPSSRSPLSTPARTRRPSKAP
jgi:hypothetical protein